MIINGTPFARLTPEDQLKIFKVCERQCKMSKREAIEYYNLCDEEGQAILLDVARAEYAA